VLGNFYHFRATLAALNVLKSQTKGLARELQRQIRCKHPPTLKPFKTDLALPAVFLFSAGRRSKTPKISRKPLGPAAGNIASNCATPVW
jgi:hypothetical protein